MYLRRPYLDKYAIFLKSKLKETVNNTCNAVLNINLLENFVECIHTCYLIYVNLDQEKLNAI